jgi:hypothetical protein
MALVNAFATAMFGNPQRLQVEFRRLTIEELQQLAQNANIVSYIRHQGTTQLLSQLLGREIPVNGGLYTYRGERIIMIVLQAPQRGAEVQPRLEDLAIYEVIVHARE